MDLCKDQKPGSEGRVPTQRVVWEKLEKSQTFTALSRELRVWGMWLRRFLQNCPKRCYDDIGNTQESGCN